MSIWWLAVLFNVAYSHFLTSDLNLERRKTKTKTKTQKEKKNEHGHTQWLLVAFCYVHFLLSSLFLSHSAAFIDILANLECNESEYEAISISFTRLTLRLKYTDGKVQGHSQPPNNTPLILKSNELHLFQHLYDGRQRHRRWRCWLPLFLLWTPSVCVVFFSYVKRYFSYSKLSTMCISMRMIFNSIYSGLCFHNRYFLQSLYPYTLMCVYDYVFNTHGTRFNCKFSCIVGRIIEILHSFEKKKHTAIP